jgi:hypothetical protein
MNDHEVTKAMGYPGSSQGGRGSGDGKPSGM